MQHRQGTLVVMRQCLCSYYEQTAAGAGQPRLTGSLACETTVQWVHCCDFKHIRELRFFQEEAFVPNLPLFHQSQVCELPTPRNVREEMRMLVSCSSSRHKTQEDKTRSKKAQPSLTPPQTSAANRLIGEVVQSRRRTLLGPSPG